MQNHKKFLAILFILFSFYSLSYGQGFGVTSKNLPSLKDDVKEPFVSLEAKFSIALPKQISGYRPVSEKTETGTIQGDAFSWNMAEGAAITVTYSQRVESKTPAPKFKDFLSKLRDFYIAKGLKFISERDLTLSGFSGGEMIFENEKYIILIHDYGKEETLYQIVAALPKDKADNQEALKKVFGSFRILTPKDVDDEIQKKVIAATPAPLPQEPAVKRQKSDSEELGLHGKVKSITEEIKYVDEQKSRTRENVYFDQNGNLIKRIFYDYKGNPMDITVYGFIDGDRVSKTGFIRYEYDPPPMLVPSMPGQPKPKYDPRYDTKYAPSKYDDKGRKIESKQYSSSGILQSRCTFTYVENRAEELCFDKDDKLTSKVITVLDSKGNEIEWAYIDTEDNKESEKYFYTYEFDDKGNWIKRTGAKAVIKNGVTSKEPNSVLLRTIVYY